MLVDSHVNLHGDLYKDDLDEVLARAEAAGVATMLVISDQLSSTDAIKKVVSAHPHFSRSVGVHPHHAKDYQDLTAARLIELAQEDDVVGIGECGLDFHYEYSDRAFQLPVFRAHIDAARETGLPLIIHCRDADNQMAEVLEEAYEEGPFTPLLHCYTGGLELAERAVALGGYVAFSGIITFKKAEDVRAVAKALPLDRLIVETDCPYLAPVPNRGRRNEPAYLPHVAEKLAEIKGVGAEEVARATTDAYFRLFPKAKDRMRAAGLAVPSARVEDTREEIN